LGSTLLEENPLAWQHAGVDFVRLELGPGDRPHWERVSNDYTAHAHMSAVAGFCLLFESVSTKQVTANAQLVNTVRLSADKKIVLRRKGGIENGKLAGEHFVMGNCHHDLVAARRMLCQAAGTIGFM
jgi:hypothetical protein